MDKILPTYYTRQQIEQIFDISKNYADRLPLRVQNEDTFRGHLLLTFISNDCYYNTFCNNNNIFLIPSIYFNLSFCTLPFSNSISHPLVNIHPCTLTFFRILSCRLKCQFHKDSRTNWQHRL